MSDLKGVFNMKFSGTAVFIKPGIIIYPVCDIGILLNLRGKNASAYGVKRSRIDEKNITRVNKDLVHYLQKGV
ncbi:MAG: hypothetical protein K6G83_00185, partial [Lachnospiraceae bacterium]|nr:hypothetical protein [Lachnospiraceae bacterium]